MNQFTKTRNPRKNNIIFSFFSHQNRQLGRTAILIAVALFTIGWILSIPTQQVVLAANVAGKWGPVINFPSIPVAAALLPNDSVITWASLDPMNFLNGTGAREKTHTAFFTPATNKPSGDLPVNNTVHDMFCPGIAMLPDGQLFVNGGGPDSPRTSIFDVKTGQWVTAQTMNYGRWYNTSVTLPNGNIFTLGGDRSRNVGSGSGSKTPGELWNTATGWASFKNINSQFLLSTKGWGSQNGYDYVEDVLGHHYDRSIEYPRLFVAPNGHIFVSGPTPRLHWLDLNTDTFAYTGLRGNDTYAQNSVDVMYNQGKILKTGGATKFSGGVPSKATYVIDINNGVSSRPVTPMKNARAFANGVILPDGKVLVVGGLGGSTAVEFSDEGSIYTPEMWDPATEQWTTMANHTVPRNYHSVALLLPDGRVFSGGGGLCGNCLANHPNAEIFSPPYLFDHRGGPALRPTISSVPGEVSYNWNFTVNMANDMPIQKFNLIRIGGVTHSINTDQRFLSLPFTAQGNNSFNLQAPVNANIAPPGYYMLFALNPWGVPSVGQMIKIK